MNWFKFETSYKRSSWYTIWQRDSTTPSPTKNRCWWLVVRLHVDDQPVLVDARREVQPHFGVGLAVPGRDPKVVPLERCVWPGTLVPSTDRYPRALDDWLLLGTRSNRSE
jgi:hypothetical protein